MYGDHGVVWMEKVSPHADLRVLILISCIGVVLNVGCVDRLEPPQGAPGGKGSP